MNWKYKNVSLVLQGPFHKAICLDPPLFVHSESSSLWTDQSFWIALAVHLRHPNFEILGISYLANKMVMNVYRFKRKWHVTDKQLQAHLFNTGLEGKVEMKKSEETDRLQTCVSMLWSSNFTRNQPIGEWHGIESSASRLEKGPGLSAGTWVML
jgi:hypothetical protein